MSDTVAAKSPQTRTKVCRKRMTGGICHGMCNILGSPRQAEASSPLSLSPPGMPLRVIRLPEEECQRWRSHLEVLYQEALLHPRLAHTKPHTITELSLAHDALSRSSVFVVANIGQEAEWRYLCGSVEVVCHAGALFVNGRACPQEQTRPRHSAPGGWSSRRQAMALAPPTPPHAHQLIRRSSSLSSVLREAGSSPQRSAPTADAPDPAASVPAATATPLPSFLCPIGHAIMHDPVVCADGFSYERSAIERWLRRFPPPQRARSPCTNLVLRHHTLVQNHSLRAAIAEWSAMQAAHDGAAALPP